MIGFRTTIQQSAVFLFFVAIWGLASEPAADMVFVKGGEFRMGDIFGDGNIKEKPVHPVAVADFYLGRTDVTVREWRGFVNETGKSMPNIPGRLAPGGWIDSHPIVYVSWFEAIEYCNWRSTKEGLVPVYSINETGVSANWRANGYRLPTEAEWEYAARSGGKNLKWPGTNKESEVGSLRGLLRIPAYGLIL